MIETSGVKWTSAELVVLTSGFAADPRKTEFSNTEVAIAGDWLLIKDQAQGNWAFPRARVLSIKVAEWDDEQPLAHFLGTR